MNRLKKKLINPAPDPNDINKSPKKTFSFKIKIPPISIAMQPKEATIITKINKVFIKVKLAYFKTVSSILIQSETPVVPDRNKNREEITASQKAITFLFLILRTMNLIKCPDIFKLCFIDNYHPKLYILK